MKIKNEKEIFDLYVEKCNMYRDTLKEPFIQKSDGRVWASEGHILIMVNQKCVSGEYETRDLGSNLTVRDYNCDESLLVSDLQDALDRCPQEDEFIITDTKQVICPECNGTGEVEADYRADYDDEYYEIVGRCPICDGSGIIDEEVRTPTGKKIPQEDSIIKLGKGYFKWHFFRTIIKTCKMLDIKQIRLVRTHETNINILELSKDIHVGLMPMYVDDEDGAKIKKRAISMKGIKV